jgi:hypothetical protein
MYAKQKIIFRSYRDGQSQWSISAGLQISRKKVKKYIEEHEKVLQIGSCSPESQPVYLSTAPVYRTGLRLKQKLTQEVQGVIDVLLLGGSWREVLKGNMLKYQNSLIPQMHGLTFEK